MKKSYAVRGKFYVGLKDGKLEAFKASETPTQASHGHLYGAYIGPFRTKRGAQYMVDHPLCFTPWGCEVKAKVEHD